jgi:hypothetical protein
MPTSNAFQLIEKKTLGSAAAGVSFTSIPSTFTNLMFSISWPSSGSSGWGSKAYFNNDTSTSAYTCQRIFENGSTVSADRPTSGWLTGSWGLGGNTLAYNTIITMQFYIFNYKATNMYKTAITRVADNSFGYHGGISSVYASNTAVTRFDFDTTSTNLPVGTVASLYGIL